MCKQEQLGLFFPIWMPFLSLPLSSVLARTVDILAGRCGSGQPCPAPALPGSVFNFATFGLMLAARFSCIALMMSEYMEHTAVFLHSVILICVLSYLHAQDKSHLIVLYN